MDGVLRVWDLDSLKAEFQSAPFTLPRLAALTSLDFDYRSGVLVHASGTGDLHAYDVRNAFAHRTIPAHRGEFCALAFGAAGLATSGLRDGTLKVWTPQLDVPCRQAGASAPVISMAWASPEVLMTTTQDGFAQLWSTADGIRRCADGLGSDLRVCASPSLESITARAALADRTWLNGKLVEADATLKNLDTEGQGRVQETVASLHRRGFRIEACLLLSRFARRVHRPVWELEALLATLDHIADTHLQAETLLAIGDLLEKLNEPALAGEYFARAAAMNGCSPQADQRIRRLLDHIWNEISPADAVRADLLRGDRFQTEIEKYTLLNKKFTWRVVVQSHALGRERFSIDLEVVANQLRNAAPAEAVLVRSVRVERIVRMADAQRQNAHWLYIGADDGQATGYALEAQDPADSPMLISHAVFDAARIPALEGESAPKFNKRVFDVWQLEKARCETKEWLRAVHASVKKALNVAAAQHSTGW
jgi:hypothetical protein